MNRSADDLWVWLVARHGIAHRADILAAGFALALLRSFARLPAVRVIRRAWIALPGADPELVIAARAGGRVSCISLARRRAWWMPEGIDPHPHLHLVPGSSSADLGPDWPGVVHWTRPLTALAPRALIGTVEDALAQIAVCQPREIALVLWESAATTERIAADTLRAVRWASRVAREIATSVQGLSDSGLETLLCTRLRACGLVVQQQIVLAGRPVDLLIGSRLVVQIDGYEFHSSSAQRSSDIAHDAQLRLRGYTVLRFSYAQVVHQRDWVQEVILRAVAQGLHLAA